MKLFVFALATLVSASAFAVAENCLIQKNNLDRKYCMDKYLETVKDKMKAEKKTWGTGLTQTDKETKVEATEMELQAKKDYLNMVQNEIALTEKHLQDLNAAQVAVAAAPVKKEKKKKEKKKLFGIKL